MKKIRKALQEKQEEINKGISERNMKKAEQQSLARTGRVKKGKKIGKKVYKYK